jgi:hypothetical protein
MTPRKNEFETDEQELIAFHLGEPCDETAIRARLQEDETFAALSESVARTLRVFSAEPVAAPDTDSAWQRLRTTLPVLEKEPKSRWWRWFVLVPVGVVAALLVGVGLLLPRLRSRQVQPDETGIIHLTPPAGSTDAQAMAAHLDRAERWLTVVNHASAPLDDETRAEGQKLLLNNAVYMKDARANGDLPDAYALERLGRVLTTANHANENGVQLRVEMNTDGLLFDLRILRQNHSHTNGDPQ